jgi:hypothetical protein
MSSVSAANPAVITFSVSANMHPPDLGGIVKMRGATGSCTAFNGRFNAATVVGSTFTTTPPIDGTACNGALTGSVVYDTGSSSFIQTWQLGYLGVVLGELRENAPYWSQAGPLHTQIGLTFEELVGEAAMNPYMIGSNGMGIHEHGNTVCAASGTLNKDSFFPTWADQQSNYTSTWRAKTSFQFVNGYGNFSCSNHGYSLVARAAISQLGYFNINSADAGCTTANGPCTAANTWNWANANVPYFANAPFNALAALGDSCSTGDDAQIPFALTPRIAGAAPLTPGGVAVNGTTTMRGPAVFSK